MLLKYTLLTEQRLHCLGGDGRLLYMRDDTFGFSRVLMCNAAECGTVAAWLCSEVFTWFHKKATALCKQVLPPPPPVSVTFRNPGRRYVRFSLV